MHGFRNLFHDQMALQVHVYDQGVASFLDRRMAGGDTAHLIVQSSMLVVDMDASGAVARGKRDPARHSEQRVARDDERLLLRQKMGKYLGGHSGSEETACQRDAEGGRDLSQGGRRRVDEKLVGPVAA